MKQRSFLIIMADIVRNEDVEQYKIPGPDESLGIARRCIPMDAIALLLSRLQLAFTISFQLIFPSLNIGLKCGGPQLGAVLPSYVL
jgi:hypothetical protein